MTIDNFSNEFDIMVNSYSQRDYTGTQGMLSFDEYEKSVFLTQAQEDMVLACYGGSLGEGFEETEELRRYLANLVQEATLYPITTSNNLPLGMDSSSKFFTLPEDVWFITYEAAKVGKTSDCHSGSTLDVVPVTQDEYHKIKRNPYRGVSGRRALRLDLSDNVIEVVSKYALASYYVRYIKKLKPIVLLDFTEDGLEIEGVSKKTACELHETTHKRILERAVQLAIASRSIGTTSINTKDEK